LRNRLPSRGISSKNMSARRLQTVMPEEEGMDEQS
jgi:hypothetical protein